ncbi:hypothetical protein PybrP1_005076 [[Pythium] brassicae (nom. inval.)]|nr:hypothetical protein PybrP1_005076 [[Pythium] brassicae (nom. inval.)]
MADNVALSADGARVLRGELPREADGTGVLLQVLGVYRHLADPALRQLLSDYCDDSLRDVFDVLLSDGARKTKCLLAPALNGAVWRGQVVPFDVMWVSEFEVLSVQSADGAAARPACLVTEFEMIARPSDDNKFLVREAAPASARQAESGSGAELVFVSSASERETGMLPLAGERRYYLPLGSDQYPLEWEARGPPASARQLCADPFAPAGRIHSIAEIRALVDSAEEGTTISTSHNSSSSSFAYPPLTGVVRVKSRVTHFGEPARSNPFPFVFHVIIGDSDAVTEVAFFGSMCAKYFGAVDEGDLVQLCGYAAARTGSADPNGCLLYFAHESDGQVLHVAEPHWKLLQALRLVPEPACGSLSTEAAARPRHPIWFDRAFSSTLDAQYAREHMGDASVSASYFDFVGVLSFVGAICRSRKRRRAASGAEAGDGLLPSDSASDAVIEYRWLKAVDRSSSVEMPIWLHDGSCPQQFRALKAGDVVVLSKLKRVVERGDRAAFPLGSSLVPALDDHVFGTQYAACSDFSVLRVNDATTAFDSVEDCSLNRFFAAKLVANSRVRTSAASDESWLEGETIAHYRGLPNVRVGSDASAAASLFPDWKTCTFSELAQVIESLEALEHKHVGVRACLARIPKQPSSEERASPLAFEVEFCDPHARTRTRRATLRLQHAVFPAAAPPSVSTTDAPASLVATATAAAREAFAASAPRAFGGVFRTLAPSVVDELMADAVGETRRPTRAFLEQHLVKSQREFLLSTHVFRSRQGKVVVEVDAILPLAPAA